MTTYNHTMTLTFEVAGSSCPSGESLTETELRSALMRRVAELDTAGLWEVAIGAPQVTVHDDNPKVMHYGITDDGSVKELGNYSTTPSIKEHCGCVLVLSAWVAWGLCERMEQLLLNPSSEQGRCFVFRSASVFEHETKFLLDGLNAELDRIDGPAVFVSEAMLKRINANLLLALAA